MEGQRDREKVYCIFNSEKEDINTSIGEAFEIYIEENTKEKVEKNQKKH